jgi:hypothetical protein
MRESRVFGPFRVLSADRKRAKARPPAASVARPLQTRASGSRASSYFALVAGRGAGAVRRAVRDELRLHQLVTAQESDSADGATLVHLGG